MTTADPQAKTIDGRARTVRELLDKAKYAIDFYQREYAWQERQVRELIDDLTGKFLDSYEVGHSRHEVEGYGHYFLGSIVISHKRGQRFVVDGQQRLTTLTLLLIHLHHLQEDRDERVEVQTLVYSEKFGRKSFNLDVPDRVEVMQRLMDAETIDPNGTSESVRNIAARYANIADHLPEEATGFALPFFVDWLLENVHLVEIEAYSDEDAYTIFETMNDRGLSLSLPEMLKGYVLANVRHEDDQRKEPLAKRVIGRVFPCRRRRGEGRSAGGMQRSQDGSDRAREAGDTGVHGACLPVMRASAREERWRISFTSRSSLRLFSIHSR